MHHIKAPRHNYKRQYLIKSKNALKLALPYITWVLIQDVKKRKERTTKRKNLSESLKSKRKICVS